VDLNQIELRGFAVLSGDEYLLEAYAHGEDLHKNTAADAIYHCRRDTVSFEQRQRGKVVNFAVANQISALGLRDQFYISGVTDVDEADCQRMLDGWYGHYSAVPRWYEAVYEEGRRNGYIRCPLSGRILWTPGLRTGITGSKGDMVRGQAERVATNFLLQCYASTIGKVGMAQVWRELADVDTWKPLLWVHDELMVEIEDSLPYWGELLISLVTETELAQAQPIPVVAGWHEGATWADLK
jgi:DNA polymerase-1